MADFYRVREAFATGIRVCTAGEILSADDPVLKGREQFCEPVGEYVARVSAAATETASAAPGEVRSVRRGRRAHKSVQPVVQPAVRRGRRAHKSVQPVVQPAPVDAPVVDAESESEL